MHQILDNHQVILLNCCSKQSLKILQFSIFLSFNSYITRTGVGLQQYVNLISQVRQPVILRNYISMSALLKIISLVVHMKKMVPSIVHDTPVF